MHCAARVVKHFPTKLEQFKASLTPLFEPPKENVFLSSPLKSMILTEVNDEGHAGSVGVSRFESLGRTLDS